MSNTKELLNSTLIIEALNKHTEETFKEIGDCDGVYESSSYAVTEYEGVYLFALESVSYDSDTGGFNYFPSGKDMTLADVINQINKEQDNEQH